MSIEAVQLGAGNNGVGLVQHQGGSFEVIEKALVSGIDYVFVACVRAVRTPPATVLYVGRREQVIALIAVGGSPRGVIVRQKIVAVSVPSVAKIDAGEEAQGLL